MTETQARYGTATDYAFPYPMQTWAAADNGDSKEQAIGTDFTIYTGDQGVDIAKLYDSEMHFVFIQIGIGMQVSSLLDQQIEAAVLGGKTIAFFHLPSRYAGSMKDQAQLAISTIKDRGFEGHLLMGDYEPAISGDIGSLPTADQAWIYHQEIEYQGGRKQAGYSNINVLKYQYHEPNWIYEVDWIMARYPKVYYHFHEFLSDYPWTVPYGYLPDEFYRDACKGTQFTKKLIAQEYFAAETLPTGGPGLLSGDGYALLMTPEQAVIWMVGTVEPPDPPPVDPDIEKRLDQLEIDFSAHEIEMALKFDQMETRISALEAIAHQHEDKDTVTATAIDKVVAFYVYDMNAAGKPIMYKYDPLVRYDTGQQFEVYRGLIDADGTVDYLQMEYDADVPLYCRADKVAL